MIKKFNKKHFFGTVIALVISITGSVASGRIAYADSMSGGFIHMSPVKTSLELNPGESYNGTFRIANTAENSFSYRVYASPYQTVGENGDASFDIKNKYTEIADWITFSIETATIAPGDSQEVSYTVKVPENAPGGGQYAIIFAETENPSGQRDFVKTNSRVGQLLFASINGENNECAKILINTINTFMFEPPIQASSLVESCGNVHAEASYVMKVYPLFSDKEIYSNEEHPEEHTILPETRRYTTVSWSKEDGAPSFGIYNVEQTVKIGKETDTVKKLVFIFPLWLIIIFILLIAAIVFKLVSNSRRRKESKRSSVNTPDPSSD